MNLFDHDKLNFEVEKFSLYESAPPLLRSLPKDIGVGLRRKDNGKPLAIVSEKYEPVQYLDVTVGLEQAIRQSGIDLTDATFQSTLYGDGEQMELTARFPAHATTIDDKRDVITPEFKFRTSHNRTWANSGMMGFFRNSCYNTLVNGNKLAYVYGRHGKNFSVPSFAAKIKNAAEFISGDGLNEMKVWYNSEVDRSDVIKLFSSTLARRFDNVSRGAVPNKVMLSNLMKVFDEETRHLEGRGKYEKYGIRDKGNLWTAYQAATSWSTHVKKNNTKPLREEKVRKMLASPHWQELIAA
tara:strand:- start:859 stop:1749 length:891 start_codon:yes stop_codon:yes gene_type:complete